MAGPDAIAVLCRALLAQAREACAGMAEPLVFALADADDLTRLEGDGIAVTLLRVEIDAQARHGVTPRDAAGTRDMRIPLMLTCAFAAHAADIALRLRLLGRLWRHVPTIPVLAGPVLEAVDDQPATFAATERVTLEIASADDAAPPAALVVRVRGLMLESGAVEAGPVISG